MKMLRVFILTVVVFTLLVNVKSNRVNAQIPTTDVALGAEIGTTNLLTSIGNATQEDIAITTDEMSGTITSMKEQQTVIETLQKATGYIAEAESLIMLGRLIGQLVCTFESLNLMMKKNGMLQFCHINAHYQIAFLNLRAAMNVVDLIINGGLRMDQGLRVANVKNAVDLFTIANQKLMTLTRTMQTVGFRQQNQSYYSNNMYASTSIYRY